MRGAGSLCLPAPYPSNRYLVAKLATLSSFPKARSCTELSSVGDAAAVLEAGEHLPGRRVRYVEEPGGAVAREVQENKGFASERNWFGEKDSNRPRPPVVILAHRGSVRRSDWPGRYERRGQNQLAWTGALVVTRGDRSAAASLSIRSRRGAAQPATSRAQSSSSLRSTNS